MSNLSQSQIQQMIVASANQYGVNPALALAIAQTESNFNPAAVSPINSNGSQDYGLMQINTSNLASLGLDPTTALDPQANINAAMQLLANYNAKYAGDPSLIAAAYNGGPGAVSSGNLPTNYINTVLNNMGNYSDLSTPAPSLSDTSGDSLSLSSSLDSTSTSESGFLSDPTNLFLIGAGGLLLWMLYEAFAD